MNVVLIGPYPPPHGGVQTHIVALQRYLQQHGVTVTVINVARHTGDRQVEGVFFPTSSLGVLKLLFRLRADVLHCHVGGTLQLRVLGLLFVATLVPGARTVLTFHSGGFPSSGAGRRAGRWTPAGWVLRRIHALIAVNREIAQRFERLGVDQTRIRLISPFSGLPQDGSGNEALPHSLDAFFRAHHPVLTTVGLLEPEYDLDLQIDALADVRKHLANAGLIIVGSGTLAQALREKLRSRPDQGHILQTGDLPHAVTLQVVKRSDLVLRTTRYDGDALSVKEALALGVPVIATDTGMRPGGTALVPAGDRRALVDSILSMLRSPQDRSSRGTQNRDAAGSLSSVLGAYREICPAKVSVPDRALVGGARKNG